MRNENMANEPKNPPLYLACECKQPDCNYVSQTRKMMKRHIKEVHKKFPQKKDYIVSEESKRQAATNFKARLAHWLNKKESKKTTEKLKEAIKGTRGMKP